jgi:hypothetical protein
MRSSQLPPSNLHFFIRQVPISGPPSTARPPSHSPAPAALLPACASGTPTRLSFHRSHAYLGGDERRERVSVLVGVVGGVLPTSARVDRWCVLCHVVVDLASLSLSLSLLRQMTALSPTTPALTESKRMRRDNHARPGRPLAISLALCVCVCVF